MVRSLFGTRGAQVSERDEGDEGGGNSGGPMLCEGVMYPTRPEHPRYPLSPPTDPSPHPRLISAPLLLLLHQDETVAKLEKLQVCWVGGGGGGGGGGSK